PGEVEDLLVVRAGHRALEGLSSQVAGEADERSVPARTHHERLRPTTRVGDRHSVGELDSSEVTGVGELDGEQALRAIEGEHEVLSRPALPDLPTDAVPDLVLAALAELPGHECEPARELLAVGERIPDLVVGGTQVAAQQHG